MGVLVVGKTGGKDHWLEGERVGGGTEGKECWIIEASTNATS